MSTSSFKKISAAAIAAVIGLSGMAHAAPITLPYVTNFSTSPDSNGDTYTSGSLTGTQASSTPTVTFHPGQGADGGNGWIWENGEADPSNSGVNATVTTTTGGVGTGAVTLNSSYIAPGYDAATSAIEGHAVYDIPTWTDVENTNLADHPLAPNTNETVASGSVLHSSTYNGNVTVGFNLDVLGSGSLDGNGKAQGDFGVRVLDSHDNLLAAAFVQDTATGAERVYYQTGTDGANVASVLGGGTTSLAASGNGATGTYSIHLDFNNQQFQIFANGVLSTEIPFGTGEAGQTDIGGISLATDNLGTNTGIFSNFSVVPEPASFAMIGLGGLMLLAKRPKRLA